jgi:hypothetical protein
VPTNAVGGSPCNAILAPLGNHAQGRLDHAVNPRHWHGVTVQVQPWERLGGPIFAHGPRNPLHQFLAVGLHPLDLACCWLLDHHSHRNLFSGFSIIHRQNLQNQTIIFAIYSTTQGFGSFIMTTSREHASLFL